MSEFEIIGLVKSQPLEFTSDGAKKIRKHLDNVGWRFGWLLFWQQIILGIGYLINLIFNFNKKRLLPAWLLAKENNIPVIECIKVNDPDTVNLIEKLKPDLIISAYFNQILKSDIIAVPKFGILNVHPGWLPIYRGAMAYFWVLKNGSESAGVSIHWIDEGIDTGTLIARRSFVIKTGMTQQRVLAITAVIGARLLKRIGRELLSGATPKGIKDGQDKPAYFPMPGSADFNEYFKTRRFFRIRDLLRYILKI
jgi:folate-dependent phosphoribosylglycinamide formyltransferase PurN